MPALFTFDSSVQENASQNYIGDAIEVLAQASQSQGAFGHDEEGNQLYAQIPGTSHDVRWGHWGLRKGFDLRKAAADFYLLYDLYIDDDDEGKFKEMFDWLLSQFIAYTDMAVGGELRHARKKVLQAYIPTPLKRAMRDGTLPMSRHDAWKGWRYFRMNYGTKALQWAVEIFPHFGGNSFGGQRWSNIARVLREFEDGELTPIIFVDTCWGLQHNGGAYFNKAWSTNGLKSVLDANLESNYAGLRAVASPNYRALHIAKRGLEIE
jgi:hypothetical protein